jgi:hypothetical protein
MGLMQIKSTLYCLTVLAGMTSALGANEAGGKAKAENPKALEQGADWINAIVAGVVLQFATRHFLYSKW